MAVIDIVVFDNSGSMQGRQLQAAFQHACDNHGPDTMWIAAQGPSLQQGRLGDPGAYDRIRGSVGGSMLHGAINMANAPGTRLTVYTDEEFGHSPTDDPIQQLNGLDATVCLLSYSDKVLGEQIEKGRERYPLIHFEGLMLQGA